VANQAGSRIGSLKEARLVFARSAPIRFRGDGSAKDWSNGVAVIGENEGNETGRDYFTRASRFPSRRIWKTTSGAQLIASLFPVPNAGELERWRGVANVVDAANLKAREVNNFPEKSAFAPRTATLIFA
jgi:hypothetical protein